MPNEQTDFGAAYEAGANAKLGEWHAIGRDGAPYTVLPPGYQLKEVPFEREAPLRIKECPRFGTVESFGQYVNRYKSEATLLFANRGAGLIYADLEYHQPGSPSWNTHQAQLPVKHSEEFQAWSKHCSPRISQDQLANLLDERIEDIRGPDAGQVLSAVSEFQLRRTANFKAAVDLKGGRVQLAYEERDEAKGGGTVVVPSEFLLGVPVYEGGDPWEVTVRLRYGLQETDNGKKLYFTLAIQRLSSLLKKAFEVELQRAEAATGLKAMLVL